MKSDKLAYRSLKYGLLLFGLLFIAIPTLNAIDPDLATFNGEHKEMDWFSFIIFILVGLLAILVFMMFQDKFAMVEMGNQKLKVSKGSEEIEVNWLDVESVDLLHFVFPPLYKLRIKGHEDYILFATSRSGLSVAGFTKDLSEMGNLINKKKREFGI
jgi:hypothetical protein